MMNSLTDPAPTSLSYPPVPSGYPPRAYPPQGYQPPGGYPAGPYYPAPQYPYYYPPQPVKKSSGLAVASLVLGILSILMAATLLIPLICGPLAILFGILSRKGDDKLSGLATAGIICGVVGLVLGLLFLIAIARNAPAFGTLLYNT